MKRSSSERSGRLLATLFACITALVLALPSASFAGDICFHQVTPSQPAAGEAFQICGPAGANFYYSWRNDPADLVPFSTDQCITFPAGLGAGTHSWEMTYSIDSNLNGPDPTDPFFKCLIELTIEETPEGPTCEGLTVTPNDTVCVGVDIELCLPEGEDFYYSWHDENDVLVSTERCITVSREEGCYEYEGTVSQDLTGNGPSADDPFTKCPVTICFEECKKTVNCPHTIGFWMQQCAQRDNGATKLTQTQMNAITAKVDDLSAFFSWADDFASFCAVMNPETPVDQREAALRQFAGTLANLATGILGEETSNGQFIMLDVDTEITCGGEEMTIGELIALADARFAVLAGMSLDDPAVKAEYAKFTGCFDDINNGIGIGPVCSDEEGDAARKAERTVVRGDGGIVARPNPLVNFTRFEYAVARDGDVVELAVFDVAGRQVQSLVKGAQPAGRFEIGWNGRASDGSQVRSGVYFVRGTIGSQSVSGRVMVVR